MKPEVEIYDTTLRDGSQGEGINFSVADKLRIAERLDIFGIHYIEGGWPGSNPKDIEFFSEAKRRKFKNAKLTAFGSTRRKGVRIEDDEQVLVQPTAVVQRLEDDARRQGAIADHCDAVPLGSPHPTLSPEGRGFIFCTLSPGGRG